MKTEDCYEPCLEVNYLSHFIMIAKLLPLMKRSGYDCRLLIMSSSAHARSGFDIKTINEILRESTPSPNFTSLCRCLLCFDVNVRGR